MTLKSSQRKAWKLYNLATLLGAFVGANSDACPIGARHGIGPWIAIFSEGT